MTILIHSLSRSTEGALKRETIQHVELLPQNHSCCRLSTFLNRKAAILERKGRMLLRIQQREDPLLQSVLTLEGVITTPIHEDIPFPGMGVEVTVEVNISAF